MPEFAEDQLRELYGYPEDMTYDQYSEAKRKEASDLIAEGNGDEAVFILRDLANCVKGDPQACMMLGDVFLEGKAVEADPWSAMLYYVAAMTAEGNTKSQDLWNKLMSFRGMLLSSRPLGTLSMNGHDAESACCEKMRQQMIQGNTSITDTPEGADHEFSMTMDRQEMRQYLGKEKHELMPTPAGVSVMDLKKCPYCGAPLVYCDEMSREWKDFVRGL